MPSDYNMKEWAKWYAGNGFSIFPVKTPDIPGQTSPGKEPWTQHGFYDATTNIEQIEKWWDIHPNANIGLATGKDFSKILVIDGDQNGVDKFGVEFLKDWQYENGQFPETCTVQTGGGGYHYFFKTENSFGSKTGLYKNVDIKSDRGYVLLPPSMHNSGNRYEWDIAPDELEIAEINATVSEFLKPLYIPQKKKKKEVCENEIVSKGERTNFLVDRCAKLRVCGIPKEVIKSAIIEINNKQCSPAFTIQELEKSIFPAIDREYWQPKKTYAEEKAEKERIEKGWEEHQKAVSELVPISEEKEVCKLALNQNGTVKQTLTNCALALKNDNKTKEMLRYNLFTNNIEIITSWWKRIGQNISDTDEHNIFLYMDTKYGLKCDTKILQAIDIIAHENQFHPVREKLNSLKWDGEKRIGNLFPRYLGAEKSQYTEEITQLFLLGAISRIFNPGCKFDTMIVLVEDKQGGGKSSMARFLAICDEWFSDDMPALDKDKAFEKLQGHWIMEMSEMLATAKAKTVESIKAFISRQTDIGRPAYGHNVNTYPRQCVFIGTTNNISFLPKDRTGNRRFLPIQINSAEAEHHPRENEKETREYILQCYAEAMEIYRSGKFTLTLNKEMTERLEAMQENFKPEDPDVGIIQDWLDHCGYDAVCTTMIYKEAFPDNEFKKPQKWELAEIGNILNHNISGWEKYHTKDSQMRFKKYGKQRAWKRKSVHKDKESVHKEIEKDGFISEEEYADLSIPF